MASHCSVIFGINPKTIQEHGEVCCCREETVRVVVHQPTVNVVERILDQASYEGAVQESIPRDGMGCFININGRVLQMPYELFKKYFHAVNEALANAYTNDARVSAARFGMNVAF